MLLEIDHNDLELFIKKHFETKLSLFIWGTIGIGKSWTVKNVSKKLAEKHGREFRDWNTLSKEEKHEIEKNPDKYFVYIDIRLSQIDPSDLRGLPSLNGSDAVEWKIPYWLKIVALKDIMGILFFDEINLAPASIQSSAYQLIHDRALGEVSISDKVGIISAGNRIEDKANVYDLGKPLQNRFDHVTLKVPSAKEWTDWAIENNVDSRIIAFINARPSLLMGDLGIKSSDMAFPTPRTWAKNCSNLIQDVKDLRTIEKFASSAVGSGVAMEFASFLKFQREIDLDAIIQKPKSIAKITDLDLKYSLVFMLTEWFNENKSIKSLDTILQCALAFSPEFAFLLLRMVIRKHKAYFRKNVAQLKTWSEIWKEYGKYLKVQ